MIDTYIDDLLGLDDPATVTNAGFLAAIFDGLRPDESVWTTAFIVSPEKARGKDWAGHAIAPDACRDTPKLNTYFSVASLVQADGKLKRQKEYFSRLFCVVLDDATDCDLMPSWRLRTSTNKVQMGFILDTPLADLGVAERLHKALGEGGRIDADRNGNNPVRYVRLPVGSNTKYSPVPSHVLEFFDPNIRHDLHDLIEALGLDLNYVIGGSTATKNLPAKTGEQMTDADSGERIQDSELVRLICTTESYHGPLLTLSARWHRKGMPEETIVDTLRGMIEATGDTSDRATNRIKNLPRMVRDAFKKFAIRDDDGNPIDQALLQHPSQDNVALVFANKYAGRMLYAHKFGRWFEWDGCRWRAEETAKAFDFARSLARKINREGKAGISSASFCNGVEAFARADRTFAITGEEFDADNYMLNTPAGTFDMLNNVLRPHDPDDRITLLTAAGPTPDGGERFKQFLDEVTGGDAELIRFLQVSLGACLSGAVESHWMLFWTGNGRNGKNTLGDLVMYVMGDYAKKISTSVLMAKTYEGHPTEIANLKGVRLATASEVSQGEYWHESRINELTGDSTLSARYMRGDLFEFKRTHKHLIYGNHRPRLRSVTEALKARIKIVPFNQSFIGREDPMLPAKLQAEAGYVMYWLLEGHREWLKLGRKLPDCAAVRAESESYFSAQSTTDMWVAERLEIIENDSRKVRDLPKSSSLYADYRRWKEDRGEHPVTLPLWAETMRRFEKVQSGGVRYRGVSLLPDDLDF